jgi:hypothetical protein
VCARGRLCLAHAAAARLRAITCTHGEDAIVRRLHLAGPALGPQKLSGPL